MMQRNFFFVGIVAAVLGTATTASAQSQFDLTYVGVDGNADILLTASSLGGGWYLASAASGSYGSFSVTSLDSVWGAPDNYFKVGTGASTLDSNGLSFDLSNSDQINLYNLAGTAKEYTLLSGGSQFSASNVKIAPAATPEPATLAVIGVGVFGLILRRRCS